MEALQVHRRRAAGQGGRRGRARPHRRPGRPAAVGVRHAGHRLRPVRAAGPGGPDRRAAGRRSTSCCARADFITVHLPKTPETRRADRRRGAAQGQADRAHRQRRPRRHRRRGGAARALRGGPGRRRRPGRLRQGAVHRQPAVRARRTSSRPRTWAPAPTRRRRRPASRSRGRCGSRWPASWCRTRSTSRAASSPRTSGPGLPLAERLGRIFSALAGGVPARIDVEVRGEIAAHDVSRARAGRAQGRLLRRGRGAGVVRQRAAARQGARRRGRADHQRARAPTTATCVTVRGTAGRRRRRLGLRHAGRSAAGREARRGRRLRRRPGAHRAHGLLPLPDRPGVVGAVGRLLGDAGINIAGMQVSRDERGRPRADGADRRLRRAARARWPPSSSRSARSPAARST